MASFIVDHLNKNSHRMGDSVVLCVYVDWHASREQSVADYIGALLKQLYWQTRNIDSEETDDIAKLYKEHMTGHLKPTYEELERMLKRMLAKFTRQFIIIDGLDELSDIQQSGLLRSIARLGGTVNVLIFSRPIRSTKILVKAYRDPATVVLEIDMDTRTMMDTQTEIELYIRDKLKEHSFQRKSPSVVDEIAKMILAKSNSSYVCSPA